MKRREFINLLGGALTTWPLAVRAQQPGMPVIGFMTTGVGADSQQIAAFHAGLKEAGYIVGQNVAVDFRSAEGQFNRFAALAADLVGHEVAVLVAVRNDAALAAKRATATTPIVFGMGGDPVALGLVRSLNQPGGKMRLSWILLLAALSLASLSTSSPAIDAAQCLYQQQSPPKASTEVLPVGFCPIREGNLCFDRLFSTTVVNNCDSGLIISVEDGPLAGTHNLGARHSSEFTCLQVRDHCSGVRVTALAVEEPSHPMKENSSNSPPSGSHPGGPSAQKPANPISELERAKEEAKKKAENSDSENASAKRQLPELKRNYEEEQAKWRKAEKEADEAKKRAAEIERQKNDNELKEAAKWHCYGGYDDAEEGFTECESACADYHSTSFCHNACYASGQSISNGRSCFREP